jgi:hypothetical protein
MIMARYVLHASGIYAPGDFIEWHLYRLDTDAHGADTRHVVDCEMKQLNNNRLKARSAAGAMSRRFWETKRAFLAANPRAELEIGATPFQLGWGR